MGVGPVAGLGFRYGGALAVKLSGVGLGDWLLPVL